MTQSETDVGCHAQVWAHTNGDGDFVLSDSLGLPWPVHICYLTRRDGGRAESEYEIDENTQQRLDELLALFENTDKDQKAFRRPDHLRLAHASEWRKGSFMMRGLIEFYRENRLAAFIKGLTPAELVKTEQSFGTRRSELGIVDRRGNLFALYADLRSVVVSPGGVVDVEVSACRVPIKKLGFIFN